MHRTAHQLGMRTTATMMFGCGETIEQRMNHLELVRNLRKRPADSRPSSPGRSSARTPRSGRFVKEEATAVEYLQTLAISRIYLDNIENVQSSWVTPGPEDLPAGPALRRQRRGQHHDRRERGVGRRRAPSRQRRGAAPHDPRRRLRPQAARHAVPDVFPELTESASSPFTVSSL